MTERPDLRAIETGRAIDSASRWFAKRRHRTSANDERKFSTWLKADPAHRRAYEEVSRSWEVSADGASDPAILAMRSEALMLQAEKGRSSSRVWSAAAAAVLLLVSLSAVGMSDPSFFRQLTGAEQKPEQLVLRTAVGHRSMAELADGSRVTLNTDSVLEIDYSEEKRHVRLVKGQAFFRVAKDSGRPFVVSAGDRQVIALGTQFEVRLENREVRVALLEGRVRVQKLAASRERESAVDSAQLPGEVLEPGEQLLATPESTVTRTADVANLVSWRTGRLRFEDTPLAEAVAEMNRYSNSPILIADGSVADIRISGSFRIGHSRSFAEMVAEAFPVRTEDEGGTIRLTRA